MREFTKEEKELIVNTPITIDCFEMGDFTPHCVYEKVEKMYADWNKRCENCIHGEEQKKAIQEGKQGSAFCMLECNPSHTCFEPKE